MMMLEGESFSDVVLRLVGLRATDLVKSGRGAEEIETHVRDIAVIDRLDRPEE